MTDDNSILVVADYRKRINIYNLDGDKFKFIERKQCPNMKVESADLTGDG